MLDEEKIGFRIGVELSYLNEIEQEDVNEIIKRTGAYINLGQAKKLKKYEQEGKLDDEKVEKILSEEKANQKERIVIYKEEIKNYIQKI